jgi:hypothetical protein
MTASNIVSFEYVSSRSLRRVANQRRVLGSNQYSSKWTSRRIKRLRRSSQPAWWSRSYCVGLLLLLTVATPGYIYKYWSEVFPTVQAQTVVSPIPTPLVAHARRHEAVQDPRKMVVPTSTPAVSSLMLPDARSRTRAGVEDYIRTIFGDEARVAIAVSHVECNPANGTYPKCQLHTTVENSIGIFQINIESSTTKVHWSRIPGQTLEQKKAWLEDPYNNTLLAYWIYTKSGWSPWSAYTSGRYKENL